MEPRKRIFADKEDKLDFLIALITIVVFSAFVYQFIYKPKETMLSVSEKMEKREVESEVIAYVEANDYEFKAIEVEEAYQENVLDSAIILSDKVKNLPNKVDTGSKKIQINDNQPDSKEAVVETIKDTLSDKELKKVEEQEIIKVKDTIVVAQEVIKEEVTVAKESIIKQAAKEKVNTQSIPDKVVEDKKEVIVAEVNENFDCVIVVGAFKEVENEVAIINKLSSLGYTHTQGVLRKGLNYVGVPIDCSDNKEKIRLLNELNQVFGIESWVKKK